MNEKLGIYFQRPQDLGSAENWLVSFRAKTLEQLVECFNREVRTGITGVHAQLVYITTLNLALNERTGQDAVRAEGPLIRPLRYITIVDGKLVQQENS